MGKIGESWQVWGAQAGARLGLRLPHDSFLRPLAVPAPETGGFPGPERGSPSSGGRSPPSGSLALTPWSLEVFVQWDQTRRRPQGPRTEPHCPTDRRMQGCRGGGWGVGGGGHPHPRSLLAPPELSARGEPWIPGEAVGKAPRGPLAGFRASCGGALVAQSLGRGPWTEPRMIR